MYLLNSIKTILSRTGILGLNFVIVILTTRLWGAEGRGIISILIADLAIIVIVNNIFTGSAVAYYTPVSSFEKLVKPAYIWVFTFSVIGALFFSLFLGHSNILYLLVLTAMTSLSSFNLSVFVGKEKLSLYNTYSFLVPVFILICILAGKFLFPSGSVELYFWAYGIAYFTIWMLSASKLKPSAWLQWSFDVNLTKKVFNYGYKSELSYFLQFLNYRFSYFVLLYYMGLKSVGLFSIGIALAESIWILSKSLSLVLYSRLINSNDIENSSKQTNTLAAISFAGTLLIGVIILFIPVLWFGKIFGSEFESVKHIVFWLYPGILFVAVANIYGHYLAAINQMKPLIMKSAYGLVVTIGLSYFLIPEYGVLGACITTSCSHLVSSAYIFMAVRFKMSDLANANRAPGTQSHIPYE